MPGRHRFVGGGVGGEAGAFLGERHQEPLELGPDLGGGRRHLRLLEQLRRPPEFAQAHPADDLTRERRAVEAPRCRRAGSARGQFRRPFLCLREERRPVASGGAAQPVQDEVLLCAPAASARRPLGRGSPE